MARPTREQDVAALPTPKRRRRAFWFDPRFAVGLILVVVSVLGVVGLVDAANASIEVLAARNPLTPGQRVEASDLVPTSVRAGQVEKLYLTAAEIPTAGVVVTRPIAAGELVPHSAVGSSAGDQLTSVVVAVNGGFAASITPGSRVDLWSAQQVDEVDGASGGFAAPTVLVSSAIVVRLVEQKNLVTTAGSSIELLVPKSDTASVLDAIANGAALSVVPVDLPLGQ
jgi:Flp pilus assembly protein CpaB